MNSMMLLFLSDYKPNAKQEEYLYGGKVFGGTQTNDAPSKCLLTQAKEVGQEIDRILCIVSDRVYHDKLSDGRTAVECYKEMVKEYCIAELGYQRAPELIPIAYDFDLSDDSALGQMNERAFQIYRQISGKLTEYGRDSDISIYIDYTGGMRDVNFLMTAIIKYLEFSGIRCEKIIYSKYASDKLKESNGIYDLNYIYEMFQLINGVNEFLTTGNARLLGEVYDTKPDGLIEQTIASIRNFSDVISLCNMNALDDAAARVAENITQLEKNVNGAGSGEQVNIYAEMFRSLIPAIKEKMYITDGKIEYPKLIRWCVDNRLLQQAITIYVEKMPLYYCNDTKILPSWLDRNKTSGSSMASSVQAGVFYTDLFDSYAEGRYMYKFRAMLRGIKNIEDPERFKEELGSIKKKEKDPVMRKAMDRLEDVVKKKYVKGKAVRYYNSLDIGQNTLENFITALIDSGGKCLHYIVYEDEEAYKKIQHGKAYIYRKKIQGIKNLEATDENDVDKTGLAEIMRYYLSVKLIRNRMNHAVGEQTTSDENTEDEKEAITYLAEHGIKVEYNVEAISSIILKGISLTGK